MSMSIFAEPARRALAFAGGRPHKVTRHGGWLKVVISGGGWALIPLDGGSMDVGQGECPYYRN
jgi:hypothetical protein